MILIVLTNSFCTYGGNTTFSLVGMYLENRLGIYGSAVKELDVTACFRGGTVRHPSMQTSYAKYHSKFLPRLPLVRFYRKRSRVDIRYETQVDDAGFLERHGFLSVDVFIAALKEVAGTMHLMDGKLRREDFDLHRFHHDVGALVAAAPSSVEDLRSLQGNLEREQKQRLETMDPWEKLDVEWEDFHPNARKLLDQPYFWSCTDDFAPHGNDTGADLLSEFRKWNRRHKDVAAIQMAVNLLRQWGIGLVDFNITGEGAVGALLTEDGIALNITDDAMVAAAFAAAKVRGCCDAETLRCAFSAIERQRLPCVLANRRWKDPAERLKALDLMAATLSKIPETAQSIGT